MKAAVISDVHANLHALEAVLAAIDADGPDELWCLGDLVGYGPRPNDCCALVRERASVCLVGNHDLAVRGTIDLEDFSGDAGAAARWTRDVIDDGSLEYLNSLEPTGSAHGVGLFHGSPRDPVWEYVLTDEAALGTFLATDEELVLVGHSHAALQISLGADVLEGGLAPQGTTIGLAGRRWILNPGSVGQPRDSDWRAAYLVLDLDERRAWFHRVEYDVDRTQSEMAEAGLPELLALRLRVGQ